MWMCVKVGECRIKRNDGGGLFSIIPNNSLPLLVPEQSKSTPSSQKNMSTFSIQNLFKKKSKITQPTTTTDNPPKPPMTLKNPSNPPMTLKNPSNPPKTFKKPIHLPKTLKSLSNLPTMRGLSKPRGL
ncbi:hypothetical protein BC829DRAFT_221668 [Chytridium lagenaria]|nr:hypothetical protein BC829DRAFT_221668 [Chytridium lagenaria]